MSFLWLLACEIEDGAAAAGDCFSEVVAPKTEIVEQAVHARWWQFKTRRRLRAQFA